MTTTLTPPASSASAVAAPRISFDEFLALNDDECSYELVDGRLEKIPVSALSSNVVTELGWRIRSHADPGKTGRIFDAQTLYRCFPWKPENGRRPDLSFISTAHLPDDWAALGYFTMPPDLAVEVLSPNDLAYDVNAKLAEYLRANVRLVWIIDPEQRMIFVHRSGGTMHLLQESDELSGEDVIPGFRCRVADLFPPAPASSVESVPAEARPAT